MNSRPIPYNQDKLKYQPIFTEDELRYLDALNSVSKSEYLLSPRNIQAFSIGFAHTSAILEGNTYSAVEAELLLTLGQTGAHKKLDEALMLKNMQSSFNYIVNEAQYSKTDARRPLSYIVKNAHAMASEGMLNKEYCGVARNEPVLITATDYVPSDIPQQLEDGLQMIEQEYDNIENTFEKAVYIHQTLSYLQYFYDHNKRTARNMCAYTLLADNKMPVMFTERSNEEYARAVISYYESEPADYSAFKEYFIGSYERVCSRMNAFAIEQAKALVNDKSLKPSRQLWKHNEILAAGLTKHDAKFVFDARKAGHVINSPDNGRKTEINQQKLIEHINNGTLDQARKEFEGNKELDR